MNQIPIQIPTQEFIDGMREYQQEYLTSDNKHNVLMWHRGSRKTTTVLQKLLIEAHKRVGLYWYIGPYLVQARSTIWTDPNTSIFRWLPEEYKKVVRVNNSDMSITFPNGSVIQAKGADHPDSLRGPKPVGVVVDEYGEIARRWGSEFREAVIEPSIASSGGWVDYSGTPKGDSNDFAYLLRRKDYFTSLKTVDDTGIYTTEQIDELRKNAVNIDFFNQEYYCKLIEGASSVFKNIENAVSGQLEKPEMGEDYLFGIDLARSFDATVLVGFKLSTNHLVYYEKIQNRTWEAQKNLIAGTLKSYNDARAIVDATGMGDSFTEQLMQMGLNVVPLKIANNLIKRNLVEKLGSYLENRYITIPRVQEIIDELNNYEYTLTANNNIVYNAPSGKHDDIVMALALAVSAISPSPIVRIKQTFNPIKVDDRTGYIS
jgi:phage FluMu gp28-like protein